MPSSLASLPLVKWAMRLKRGSVELRGELSEALDLPFGDQRLHVGAGPVHATLEFVGGALPSVARAELEAAELGVGEVRGRRLAMQGAGQVEIDGEAVACGEVRLGRAMEAVVDRIGSVSVSARAEPDGDLLLRLGGGVEVVIPEGVLLTVNGASVGPAHELQLSQPLVVGFGGEGLRLSHEQFRMISRLATVRLGSAILHPDGSVALEGRGSRPVELALRAPLQRASARLSDLVRRSPNFQRVRAFLRHVDSR